MNVFHGSARLALVLSVLAFGLAAQTPPPNSNSPASEPSQSTKPGAAETAAPKAAAVDPNKFDLGAEDVILVRVWREPDLSGTHIIRPDGKITLPLVGDLVAAGVTPVKFASRIADALSKYVRNPQVTVQVQAVRSKRYYVSGGVYRPGAYPLVVPTRVFDALTLAGGFREFANKKKITIVRGTKRLKFNYKDVVKGKNLEQNIFLEPGDTISVPE